MSQKLKEKLARWAGFKFVKHSLTTFWRFTPQGSTATLGIYGSRWITPDGKVAWASLPDLDRSLDECFEWLVPKIEGFSDVQFYRDGGEWGVSIRYRGLRPHLQISASESTTPPLALCKAIEQYIDKQETNV